MRNQKENNVYSNEFYDHLYKLESKREGEHSWTSIVDANDPDLVWLNNYVKQHKLFDEYKCFYLYTYNQHDMRSLRY